MVMGYWSVAILFWQLSIDHIVNVQCKRCGLGKTRLRHPSLPFDSLPYPTRTICRRVRTYVRTYARSITWQPNENRLTIFHEYGALSCAGFARGGDPLLTPKTPSKSPQLRPKPKISVNFITFKTQRRERCYDPLSNSKTRRGFLISAVASL